MHNGCINIFYAVFLKIICMKFNVSVFIIIFIFSILISCEDRSNNKVYKVSHIKDIECNIPFNVKQIKHKGIYSLSDNSFYYFNSNNNTIGIYNIEKQHNTKIPTPFQRLIKKRRSNSEFYFLTSDSIYLFDRDLKAIVHFDTSGTIKNKYSINSHYPPNPMASNFFVITDYLYYSWLPESNMRTSLERRNSFNSISPICRLHHDNLDREQDYYIFGEFPDNYKSGNNYLDYGPGLFVGFQNQLIVSYSVSDKLYIYKNSELLEIKKCKSNYIKKFNSISDENFSNLSYCQNFQAQEPRYINVIIDPFKRMYYRVVKHRMKLENQNINEAKWSLIIMNEHFDVLGEAVFSFSNYMPDIIVPSANGLYIKTTPKSKADFNGNLNLSLITLQNEI